MWNVVCEFWVVWVCGLLSASLALIGKHMWSQWHKMDRRQTAIELGVQALLRDRILTAYYHYLERDWITLHGLENVEAMYTQYHALGGNGTVTKLVEDLRKLEVRDK